jgi:condensin complex subunit 3
LQFIKLFDIYDGTVAEKVLAAIFETKPEFVECIEFDGPSFSHYTCLQSPPDTKVTPVPFYEKLTPDTAFIVRNYLSHLHTLEDPRLADIEPVVTTLAFLIQAAWGRLNQLGSSMVRDEDIEVAQEFVVGELVAIAVDVDYGDEIGRRKMFELMRTSPPSSLSNATDEKGYR